jgi:hypothetical protein
MAPGELEPVQVRGWKVPVPEQVIVHLGSRLPEP